MPILVALDLVAIQRFVFASNRLREVVGASAVVEWATSAGEESLLPNLTTTGQCLSAGGGNALLRFDSASQAQEMVGRYTRALAKDAPALDVAVGWRPYDQGSLARALKAVQVDLARAKLELRPSVPLLGLGVTAACRQTGLPASAVVVEGAGPAVPMARAVTFAREHATKRPDRWKELLPAPVPEHLHGRTLAFPKQIDHLGRTADTRSLMAVVHVDGNRVGERIVGWLDRCINEGREDDTVEAQHREWSGAVDELVRSAWRNVVARVVDNVRLEDHEDGKKVAVEGGEIDELAFLLKESGGETFLPVAPVLLGGDDLTFVCDGRLGLDLATVAVRSFAEGPEVPHLGRLSACAGVAIVRTHAPFSRAVALADDLCRSAKRQAVADPGGWSKGGLDWHIGATRPAEPIEDIRARQYHLGGTSLTCRPYSVPEWEWLRDELLGDGSDDSAPTSLRGPAWRETQGKARRLARIAADGPAAVERALDTWGLELPADLERRYGRNRTPLLDAVELLDRAQRLRP